MKKKYPIRRGTVLMIVGAMMILGALSLLLYNRHKEQVVGERSQEVLTELEQLISALEERQEETSAGDDDYSISDEYDHVEGQPFLSVEGGNGQQEETLPDGVYSADMNYMYLDGHYYIGVLDMPTLGITLPVQWGWSDSLMDTSPCRYNGTLEDGDLIIMAHNYSTHFGTIFDLAVGDAVSFTDVLGVCTDYEVCGVDIFGRSEISKMYEGDWDLTLFTCVPNTYNRIAVRCKRVQFSENLN
jgi:sortase A